MAKTPDLTKVEALLSRGIENVYPSREFLRARLLEGKKLKIYLGIDPTGPTLHLGHAIPLMKLRQFQELGHQVVLLMGDFTAMIGDPTDKAATRKVLTRKEVLSNLKNYKKQASAILSFSGKNPAEIRFNSKWLGKMKFSDVLSLASKMTVQQMLERDMFERRIGEGKPIHIHEFMYPLMQGYDSVAMEVDGEVGGNDQTFNMLAGRTLEKEILGKEKFVITTKLLADPSGIKMGKTEGNMVALSDSPEEMFGKIMSWPDGMIIPAFELCTTVPEAVINEQSELISRGGNPRDAKLALAKAVAALYFGEKKAAAAKEAFLATFQKGEIPEDVQTEKFRSSFLDTLVASALVASKGEGRRLIASGAVSDIETGEKVTDPSFMPDKTAIYRIGKHRFLKITV
jgi:tyrosyl-tRNA synthetase